jgi:hypothetical protein
MEGPSEMLAFVRPGLDSGHILSASGEFLTELRDGAGGWDIADHNMPTPREHGLLLFDGWIEVGHGDSPDVSWVGEWRRLTHWEMARVRFGLSPSGHPEHTADFERALTGATEENR